MTCTGDQEVYAIFKRLSDNLGELVYMILNINKFYWPARQRCLWLICSKQISMRSAVRYGYHMYVSIIVVVVIDSLAVPA